LTDPANQLPDEIKANVMSLSIFVDKQTTKALRSTDPKELDILITINRNLAAGLRTNAAAAQPGVATADAPTAQRSEAV
jgi:flagellar protein FlaF